MAVPAKNMKVFKTVRGKKNAVPKVIRGSGKIPSTSGRKRGK